MWHKSLCLGWAEPQRHTIVGSCVFVYICVCVFVSVCLYACNSGTGMCNAYTMRQYHKVHSLGFFDLRLLFSLVTAWFAHLDAHCEKSKIKWKQFFTAGRFSTRRSCLCHRPGCNMNENTKTRLSKTSCHLPVHCSVAACNTCKRHAMAG